MSFADEIFGRDSPTMQISTSWRRGLLARRHLQCPDPRGPRLHHEAGQPEPLDEIVSALI
jgi:hypothetical protein